MTKSGFQWYGDYAFCISKHTYIATNQHKINTQITAPELRVIDDAGENLGVMPLTQALELAQSKELDLIEINATAVPPIAKIINFDKFRYQQEKEQKKQQQQQKAGSEMKQVRTTIRAAENDMRIKAKRADEFLEKGHKVEIMIALRGREKYNNEWIQGKITTFLNMIQQEYRITAPQKKTGRGIVIQIAKK